MNVCISPEKLYERDPKLKRADVQILQEWLKKQPHLPKLEEMQVILFLHSCYYRIEAAKSTIDKYFTRRTLYPDLFQYPGEDVLRTVLSVSYINVLPKTTPQGYSVFFLTLLDPKVEKYVFLHQVILTSLVGVLHYHRYGFENGTVIVFDFKGSKFGHVMRVNLTMLKHALEHVQEGQPLRIKGIHIVNTPSFMDKVMSMLKSFLSNDLFNLIQLHPTLETFYKYVPKECLPKDYDGDLPSLQLLQEETTKELLDNVEFFRWHESQVVDESKRAEKSTSGMEGTFKKLEID